MKQSLIYTGLALLVLSSCSTAYRAGQTPDDVYYSPARETDSYVVVDRNQNRYNDRYDDYDADRYYEDRFLRMRVMNRGMWSSLDYYYANPYAYSPYNYYHSWNSPWNSYWAWNSFYNPYFGSHMGWGYGGGWNSWAGGGWGGWGSGIIVGGPIKTTTRPSRALVFNPAGYLPNQQGTARTNSNGRYAPVNVSGSRYNNSNSYSGNNSGRVSNNNNSYNPSRNNNNSTPSRSYTPSSSSGGSRSSSSSSSGGGVSRPIR